MHAPRRPRRPLLHWLMLVGLVLGQVFQPVLASMGELHELSHGLSEAHLHADEPHDIGAELTAQAETEDRAAGALHVVHHFAHCCGQTAAVTMPALAVVTCFGAAAPPAISLTQRLASGPALAPFRPPIGA